MSAPDKGRRLRILTDVPEPRVPSRWNADVEFRNEIVGLMGISSDFKAVWNLFRSFRSFDALILNGNRSAVLFTTLLAISKKRLPRIVMIDCLWYEPQGSLSKHIKKIQMRIMSRSIDRFVVWASHEVKDYAKTFHIPEEKLLFLPHHHTLEGYRYDVSEGDYIFSGGDGDRDYPTLLRAIEHVDCRVIIATRLKNWNGDRPIPPNVEVRPSTHEEFRKLMAGSKMVVLPMRGGLLHSGGQQTFLNAMAMGKVVIVVDDRGARDYIRDGIDGFVVGTGDHVDLREKISRVLQDKHLATSMGHAALESATTKYSTGKCMNDLVSLAESLLTT